MSVFHRPFPAVCRLIVVLFVLTGTISNPTADAQPADSFSLESTFRGEEVIFAPQQSVIVDVVLHSTTPNTRVPTPLTLTANLTNLALPDHPVIARFTTQIAPNVPLPISFVTPEKDGVYEITLDINQRIETRIPILPRTIVQPTTVFSISVESRRQFVVLGSHASPRLTGDWMLTDRRNLAPESRQNEEPSRRLLPQLSMPPLPRVTELPKITDLPKPTELLRIPRPFSRQNQASISSEMEPNVTHFLPGFLYLPVSSGHILAQSEQHSDFSALSPAGVGGVTWHSLMMNTAIGKPYLVEIDYPVNFSQTLGIAVAHSFSPLDNRNYWGGEVNVATNLCMAEEIVPHAHTESVATHRLLFWAKSEHPELILVNRQPHREALFRNIRISQVVIPGQQDDLRLPKLFEGTAQRKRIGQIQESDIFPNLTGAGGSMDWQLIYERCSRLLDILCRGGYDGVTLTVLSQRSNDAANGLEIMFRRFNSEGLTLIPAVKFDMPIPSLERWLQLYPATAEEICIGDPTIHHYNLLSPVVQRAMVETILELVDRFGHHPSFGGVAIVLSPDTYAQLPFALYPPDDITFMQFRHDAEKTLDVSFPDEQQSSVQKNELRLQFLENKSVWETWVRWRAAKVSGFYADLAKQIAERRGDAPLYLLGGAMLDQRGIQQFCVPTLPRNFTALQAIQLLGFDLPLISQAESLHFLKPVHVADASHRERGYSYDGLDYADTTPLFSKSGMLSGVQFVRTDTDYFVTTPAHIQSRKRFVRQLAQADVLMFMDAGVTLPFGQESAQFDLLDTYRRLPPVPFQTFQYFENQPLTIRTYHSPDGMLMYIVNDAPFSVEADFVFTAGSESRITELTGHRMIHSLGRNTQQYTGTPVPSNLSRHTWRVSLSPYDLLAIQISDTNASIDSVSVHRPPSVDGELRLRIEELAQRVHAAQSGVQWNGLVNADFELPVFDTIFRNSHGGTASQNPISLSEAEVIIPGWQHYGSSLIAVLDQNVASTGQHSIRLTNNSPEPGTFLSEPFALPATGRLDVSMFIGIPADVRSLPVSVVLSAKHHGQQFLRIAPIEATLMPHLANVAPRNGVRWHPVRVPFRLPLESLEEVRVGVQYSGNGTVWIDDVALSHVTFSSNEIVELYKQLPVANQRCSSGRVSELISMLEGYWAQFLFDHVPVSAPRPVVSSARAPVAAKAVAPSPSLFQQVRGWFGGR